jgi:DNA (cytosine-5)-methyltransferase 1
LLALDLFCGAGGWSLACNELNIEEVGVDNMPETIETRKANGLYSIEGSVLDVPNLKGDILIASPPCQPYSRATITPGKDKEKMALTYAVLDRVENFDHILMENVKAAKVPMEEIAETLREKGYNCWVGVLNSEQYGTPQARQRAILIGSRTKQVSAPKPTHSQYHRWKADRLDAGVEKWVSMAKALSHRTDLPDWAKVRPSPTVVGSFRPDIIAAPGYRKPGDGPRQNAPDSVNVDVWEAGVLQDFPENYIWKGSRTKQFLQVGNAIPVKMAKAIIETII